MLKYNSSLKTLWSNKIVLLHNDGGKTLASKQFLSPKVMLYQLLMLKPKTFNRSLIRLPY